MPTTNIPPSSSSWTGLSARFNEPPQIVIEFFSYGILFHKRDATQLTTYPVSAADLARAFAERIDFSTGLLNSNTLLVRSSGSTETIIEYRKPQFSGIWLDDLEEAVRLPLPGLVLMRQRNPLQLHYSLFAVKRRPQSLSEPLYAAPLPNVDNRTGSICWGTVPRPAADSLGNQSLTADWTLILGSRFGNHAAAGKSNQYRDDIRKLYFELQANKTRTYPKRDLVDTENTLERLLKRS